MVRKVGGAQSWLVKVSGSRMEIVALRTAGGQAAVPDGNALSTFFQKGGNLFYAGG